jgi:hypothetical protein
MNSKKSDLIKSSCFSRRLGKKGILGGIISTFIAVIVILIILVVFVFASGIIKKAAGVKEGVKIVSEQEVGIANVFNYLPSYTKFMDVKVLVRQGKTFEAASMEAAYG